MKVALIPRVHSCPQDKTNMILDISDICENFFDSKDFGDGINALYIGIYILDYNVVEFKKKKIKYTVSTKTLEYGIDIPIEDFVSSNIEDSMELLKNGIFQSFVLLENRNIPNFNIKAFINEFKQLLSFGYSELETKIEFYKNKTGNVVNKSLIFNKPQIPQELILSENEFWEIISNTCLVESSISKEFYNIMSNILRLKSDAEIIGFELKLRTLLEKLNNETILKAARNYLGNVTDDNFLYFRCLLISLGRKTFYYVLNDPKNYSKIKFSYSGEQLLYVADKAFELKHGSGTFKELPRSVASKYISYDF